MQKKLAYLIFACLCGVHFLMPAARGQSVFVNEIHYDNDGTDTGEGVEVAGPAGTDLSAFSLVLYNGSGGTVYQTLALSGTIPGESNGYGAVFYAIAGLQNGAPDGIALVQDTTVIQFLSYEGAFTATDGVAAGLTSEDIGVSESASTLAGTSLQLAGTGAEYADFFWLPDSLSTYGSINVSQQFAGSSAPVVFVNEIHYDNDGTDVGEAIELAGTAGTDLSGWSLVLYNGSNGAGYSTTSLSGVFADETNGYGFLSFYISGIQNGSPDGIALVDATDQVIQFLSYEGTFMAVGGAADSLMSTDIGIAESSSTPVGNSLQLTGAGSLYEDFTWVETIATFDSLNSGQSFGEPQDTTETEEPAIVDLWINEIHYDNVGADVGEGIEVAGTAGADLAGYALVLYNGSGGTEYGTIALSGTLTDQQNSFGTKFFTITGLQNGSPDGVALVAPDSTVLQFLSYEGTFMAMDGLADSLTSEDVGVEETSATPAGYSLQLQGVGNSYTDFTWVADVAGTYDSINTGQTFLPAEQVVFINEIHYDNASTDVDEAIEVAGSAGLDLSGWSLVLYNGNDGAAYATTILSGVIPNQDNGYGTLYFAIPGIQNGSPDGVALVNAEDTVVQFLSYEGSFVASAGPASGMMSEDIGVEETGSTSAGYSLQLTGAGFAYADFTWSEAIPGTFGAVNTGQYFGDAPDTTIVEDSLVLITIAEARTKALGTEILISGILTATDQFAGPAFIQDTTGGIAVYDAQVYAGGFAIGDEIQLTGTLDAYAQMLEVVSVSAIDTLSFGNPVTGDTLTISELAAHEGELVTVVNVSFDDPSGLFYPNSNYVISDSTGSMELRIDAEAESLVGRIPPQGITSVTAIVGSYNGILQLLPRFAADVPDAGEYEPAGSGIPKDSTFDVATWNMEFFGSTLEGYGPADVALQLSNAIEVIRALEADVIAVQEVSSDSLLDVLVDSLGTYARVCSDVYSYSFNPPDPTFPAQKLCFIYNTSTVALTEEKVLFEQFYQDARTGVTPDLSDYPTGDAQSFWASGRLPYMITVEVNILGSTSTVRLVNVHAKSGSSGSDLQRKEYDARALKDTLDAYYSGDQVILLGDYNDDVDESIGGGATPYEDFVLDTANYQAVTSVLSDLGFRSYLFSDNMIDHITITEELFVPYIEHSVYTFIPFHLVSYYSGTTSDHLPVVARFELAEPIAPLFLAELPDVHLMKGYEAQSVTLVPEIYGGKGPYIYTWSDGSSDSVFVVTSEFTDSVLLLSVADAIGQTAQDTVWIDITDVTCTKGLGRFSWSGVEMCNGKVTVCVQEHFVEHFLEKGYLIGACEQMVHRSCKATNYPWSQIQTLFFDFSETAHVQVEIYDYFGNLKSSGDLTVEAGTSEHDIILPSKGLFYVKLYDADGGNFNATFRMIWVY